MTKMRQWSMLTAVAVIIVFAAGWFMLVKPQKTKAAGLRDKATTQEQANAILNTQIATLQQEEKDLPQQQAALRKFTTQVPDNAAEPTIIRQLSAAANGAGVDLISMTPGAATPVTAVGAAPGSSSLTTPAASVAGLVQLPITIGVTGTFPNMESFFQSLETLPRALLVTGWSMCPVTPSGAASGGPASGGGATCTAPTVPGNKTLPADALGGTLSATIFYAPPAGTATSGSTLSGATVPAGTTTTTGTTPTTTATTPATTPSTAATPATTGGTPPPAS